MAKQNREDLEEKVVREIDDNGNLFIYSETSGSSVTLGLMKEDSLKEWEKAKQREVLSDEEFWETV